MLQAIRIHVIGAMTCAHPARWTGVAEEATGAPGGHEAGAEGVAEGQPAHAPQEIIMVRLGIMI